MLRRAGAVLGLALAAGSFLGLALPQASVAQEASEKTEVARVEKSAYYTAEADGALPATLTAEFPPGLVCILVPQVCSNQAAPVTGPLGEVVEPVFDASLPDWQAPQPVEPGTLPVGMLGGKTRYTSNLKFALPDIPSGSMINRFDLVLTQSAVSYALESPAFRQAVLAGLVTYQTRSPDEFTKFVGDVATTTTPLAATAATGIELCAITAAWDAAKSADATTQPARDCIFGANGVYDDATRTWTFDLSLLAQAWLDGTTPNEGVYLGPLGAENLAFGDPDTSTNWQVSLGSAEATQEASRPKIRYSYSEGFGDEGTFEEILDAPIDDTGGAVEDLGGVVPTSDPFAAASGFDDSALTGGVPSALDAPPTGATGAPIAGTLAAQSRPQSPWWLWLLLPLGLAMAYAFGRSIEDVPTSGRPSTGALSRLMATDTD